MDLSSVMTWTIFFLEGVGPTRPWTLVTPPLHQQRQSGSSDGGVVVLRYWPVFAPKDLDVFYLSFKDLCIVGLIFTKKRHTTTKKEHTRKLKFCMYVRKIRKNACHSKRMHAIDHNMDVVTSEMDKLN
jgi:hypothetical protein